MHKVQHFLSPIVVCAFAMATPACGGGPGPGHAPSLATGLPLDTTPTAGLPPSQTGAAALAAEIQDGAAELVKAGSTPSDLPGTVGGVEETLQCSALSTGGTGTATVDDNQAGSTPVAGSSVSITYNNCTIVEDSLTESIDGSLEEEYVSYDDATDFTLVIQTTDLTETISGEAPVTFDFSETLTVSGGQTTVSYNSTNGGSLQITASDVVVSGDDVTITTGSYVYMSAAAAGIVEAVYTNWEYDTITGLPISGTVTITGANNAMAVIQASSSGYTVTYTSSTGVTTSYTVTNP
jgi:hypothetical protein